MAGRSSLNAKNLQALGAARLAELLLTLSKGDAEAYLAEYRDQDPGALTLLHGTDAGLAQRRAGAEEWCDARLAALEALGRHDEAQQQRWEHALMELSRRHLRDYLKRLPASLASPAGSGPLPPSVQIHPQALLRHWAPLCPERTSTQAVHGSGHKPGSWFTLTVNGLATAMGGQPGQRRGWELIEILLERMTLAAVSSAASPEPRSMPQRSRIWMHCCSI